jgi:hypothetical protein
MSGLNCSVRRAYAVSLPVRHVKPIRMPFKVILRASGAPCYRWLVGIDLEAASSSWNIVHGDIVHGDIVHGDIVHGNDDFEARK